MERRLIRLEEWFARAGRRSAAPEPPPDWRRVPFDLPECFTAMSEEEKAEWGALMADYSAPGAWRHRSLSDPMYGRLAELDRKVDWHAGISPV